MIAGLPKCKRNSLTKIVEMEVGYNKRLKLKPTTKSHLDERGLNYLAPHFEKKTRNSCYSSKIQIYVRNLGLKRLK